MFKLSCTLVLLLLNCTFILAQPVSSSGIDCCGYPIKAIDVCPLNSTESLFANSSGCSIQIWGIKPNGAYISNYQLNGHTDDVSKLAFSHDGYSLISASKDQTLKIWNLILNKTTFTLRGHTAAITDFDLASNGSLLASCDKQGRVILWNVYTGEKIIELLNDNISANTVQFNANDSLLAIGYNDGKLKIWNLKLNKFVVETFLHNEPINTLLFKEKENVIISGSTDRSIKIFDIDQRNTSKVLIGHKGAINTLSLRTNQSNQLVLFSGSDDQTIKSWDISEGKELKSIQANCEVLAFSNSVSVRSESHGTRDLNGINISSTTKNEASLNHLLLVGGDDKKIKFLDVNDLSVKAELLSSDGISFLKTPDNYFYASSQLDVIPGFISNETKVTSSYLTEIKYNRPDIVLNRLNVFNDLALRFNQSYSKRISRNNLDSTLFMADVSLPSIRMIGELPTLVNEDHLTINFEVSDKKSKITEILFEINGVCQSYIPKNGGKLSFADKQDLILSNGKNAIKITAINERGIKSETQKIDVFYNGAKKIQNLYVLSIGVSNLEQYIDCKFCAKDAGNLIDLLKEKGIYDNVYSELITDSLVSRERILSFKNLLKKSTVNDVVIIFYSGFGLLSNDFSYYLAAHNTNYKEPEKKGILYEELKGLLTDIPARQRLILLDANTFSEQEILATNDGLMSTSDSIKYRGAVIENVPVTSRINVYNYFHKGLDKDGIITISAAAPDQLVYELPNISNGTFYQSLSSVLNNNATDLDNDRIISVNELYQSISKELEKLSGGKQNPELINRNNIEFGFLNAFTKIDNRPPSISIIEPSFANRGGEAEVVESEKITLKGAIYDDSGVKFLKVNGQNVVFNADGGFEHQLDLEIGSNSIDILTEDKYGNVMSKKYTLINNYKGPVIKGKYYALLIGVADYKMDELDLDFPVLDAQKLKKVLSTQYTFDEENITLLSNPTRSELYEAFSTLENMLTENDNLLIFYAGHGAMKVNADQGYWLPSDATKTNQANWVTNDDIVTLIKPLQAKHILLISDACFSGKMFFKTRDIGDTDEKMEASIEENEHMKSRRAITSGALETVPDKSVFIEYLTDYLTENKEKWLSSKKLYVEIKDKVTNRSQSRQKPLDGRIEAADDQNGDFLFIRR